MRYLLAAAVSAAVLFASCDFRRAPKAYGNANSIIVIAPDRLWSEVSDSMEEALEPRIFTVRSEKTFKLTQVSPADPRWGQLRKFRQVLVLGRPEDGWMKPVVDHADGPVPAPPAVIEARDVWANDQVVTGILLPDHDLVQAVENVLPELHQRLDQRFRRYVSDRMFMSGVNDKLAQRLEKEAGFALTLPEIYKWQREGSDYVFTNSIAEPREIYRVITVTWRPGLERLGPPEIAAWRDSIAAEHYPRPQVTPAEQVRSDAVRTSAGHAALEVHGLWESPPGLVPAGGPFIDWIVQCPSQGRTYLLDAWLYAPSKDKYEYMIQLRSILASFRCGDELKQALGSGA